MSPSTRNNTTLAKKIATLQLRLAPLVPLPSGPPHPDFPPTLMAFHLLTEDQLDSIAHYYHQSTPGIYTLHYPAPMGWDKDFLSKTTSPVSDPTRRRRRRHSRALSEEEDTFLSALMETVEDLASQEQEGEGTSQAAAAVVEERNSYAHLTDSQRIRIKRRKVGKFIGLVGMETPVEEVAGWVRWGVERAVERGREEGVGRRGKVV